MRLLCSSLLKCKRLTCNILDVLFFGVLLEDWRCIAELCGTALQR